MRHDRSNAGTALPSALSFPGLKAEACRANLVNKKTGKFTIDALVDMLAWIGKPVRLAIG